MKRIFVVLLCTLNFPAAVADTIGLHVGGGYWLPSYDGNVVASVDVEDELGLDDVGSLYAYIHIEHPIPFVPNVRLARTNIDEDGRGTLATNFSFEGVNFVAGQITNNTIDVSHTDFTMYYELYDVGADFDLGLTARWIEGEVVVGGVNETADVILPMLYARGKVNLPFTGTYIGAHVNAASYSGDSVTDAELKVGWQTENFILPEFGVEVGYRQYDIDLDESVDIELELTGAFINFIGHF